MYVRVIREPFLRLVLLSPETANIFAKLLADVRVHVAVWATPRRSIPQYHSDILLPVVTFCRFSVCRLSFEPITVEAPGRMTLSDTKPEKREQEWTPLSLAVGIIGAIGLFLLIGQVLIWFGDGFARFQAEQEANKPVLISSMDHDGQWRAMNAKIDEDVVAPLGREYDPEGYKKLGGRVWAVSNEFRRWAALAAAQSDSCDRLSAVANWNKATRENLAWRVECGNGEVFLISEDQARGLYAQFSPDATLEDRQRYAALITVARPVSAMWQSFDAGRAVVTCERVLASAAVSQSSFEGSGRWSVSRDEEAGIAVIERQYNANNAFGATLTGTYRCTFDVSGQRVTGLVAKDFAGLHRVL